MIQARSSITCTIKIGKMIQDLTNKYLHWSNGIKTRLASLQLYAYPVQVSLIYLFISLDLDHLLATRTAPYHSWRNPVEKIKSTLNLGLQTIGLMRSESFDQAYETMSQCILAYRKMWSGPPSVYMHSIGLMLLVC